MNFIGKILGKRYEIVEQLGGGGMALVFRAHDNYLHREVTVKILRPQYTGDADFVERFRREAQAVASLSHPNTVSVYDVGEEDGIHYIVMEYIEGRNLKEIIREHGRLSQREAVDFARQICLGLDHAHKKGIIHRDVKPHNILVTKEGRVKVTDFGIARAVTASTVTQAGTIIGSVHYIAPEQVKGESGGFRSDIYSVGVVLYEMVTGRLPFEGDTPIAMALKHIQEEPPAPSLLNPEISPELEKVILRAMAKHPEQRYDSAWEMAEDLRTVLAGEISDETRIMSLTDSPTMILPPVDGRGKTDGPQKPKGSKKRWVFAIIALVLLGLLGGGLLALSTVFNVKEVQLPNLVGQTEDSAKSQLSSLNLQMVPDRQNSDEQPEGKIIRQDPGAYEMVKEGRTINVTVSLGPTLYDVPDVKGKTLDEAISAIRSSQMAEGETTKEYDETVPEGTVIEQNPDPEQNPKMPKGTKIDIIVSKGPELRQVSVPNVIGQSQQDAQTQLTAASLVMVKSGEVSSDQYFSGTVVSQDPVSSPSQFVQEGSKVYVQVSSGPGPAATEWLLTITIPPDNITHPIKALVYDAKDPNGRVVYEDNVVGGTNVQTPVTTYGSNARYEVYIDGKLSKSKPVSASQD